MASSKVSAAITYEKPGTQPPMFVAGTFSDPPWKAYEMEYDTDANGEHLFKKEIQAQPGSKVQYKFRVGLGEWWVLHEGMPTVTDSNGNTNNELEIQPSEEQAAAIAAEVADSATLLNVEKPDTPVPDEVAGKIGYRRMSSTPITEVANTAAEVADTARELDKAEPVIQLEIRPDSVPYPGDQFEDFLGFEDEVTEQPPPLFAHECIGMYDDNQDVTARDIRHEVHTYERNEVDAVDIDLNDPTLERFPSNRDEIIDTVRKLETGLEEDQPAFDGAALSPIFPSARRGSDDPVGDLLLSPVPVSPILSRAAKHLDASRSPRLSATSNHPSAVSLHSISEADEPTQGDAVRRSPVVLLSTPRSRSPLRPLGSDEDEGVVLKEHPNPKAKVENSGASPRGAFPSSESPGSPPSGPVVGATEGPKSKSTKDHGGGTKQVPLKTHAAPEQTRQESPRIVIEAVESVEASIEHHAPGDEDNQAKTSDHGANTSEDTNGQASTTSRDLGNGSSSGDLAQLRKRDGVRIERSGTPASTRSASIPVAKKGGWLKAFFRLLFVDSFFWIGGFVSRLCGNRRQTLTTAAAALFLASLGWWKLSPSTEWHGG